MSEVENQQTENVGMIFGLLVGLIVLLAVFFIATRPAAVANDSLSATETAAGDTVAAADTEPTEAPTEDAAADEAETAEPETPQPEVTTVEATEPEADTPAAEDSTDSQLAELNERSDAIMNFMRSVVYGEDGPDPTPVQSAETGGEVEYITQIDTNGPSLQELNERSDAIMDFMSLVVYGEDGPDDNADAAPMDEDAATPEPTEPPTTPEPVTPTATPTPAPAEPTPEPTAADDTAAAPADSGTYTEDQINSGQQLFAASCAGCHGMDATGITGLGKDLVAGDFSVTTPDDELIAMIQEGRPFNHPDNTTGIEMPANGGNPGLNDTDLQNIVAYLRSLQSEAGTR